MAQDLVDLLIVRAFGSLDVHTALVNADPSTASFASNVDTAMQTGAISPFAGRRNLFDFPELGAPIATIARYDVGPTLQFLIAQSTTGTTSSVNMTTLVHSTLTGVNKFTMAVQSNGVLYLNSGQQIFYGQDGNLHFALWQYPQPSQALYSVGGGGAGTLPAGQYAYAFAQVIQLPSAGGGIQQITTAIGADIPYLYQFTATGSTQAALAGQFAGTTPDGYPYTTQVYRRSSLTPVWYLLTTLTSNSIFFDNTPDLNITGNAVLIEHRDPPPTGGSFGINPIATLNNSMWVLINQNNANTYFAPQMQMWYSIPGQPWSFDAVNQVELVGTSDLTLLPGSAPAAIGEFPSALAAVGSYMGTFKTTNTWINTGNSQTTYQEYPLFNDISAWAPLSVVTGNGLIFWLTTQGVFSYDGANLQYLSDQIYNLLQSLPISTAIGAYTDLRYFLSFPTAGITLVFYLPSKLWTTLPYASQSFAFQPNQTVTPGGTAPPFGQLLGGRAGTAFVDAWRAGGLNDLGNPIIASWVTQATDSGDACTQKTFQRYGVFAPQSAYTATVSVIVDGTTVASNPFVLNATPYTAQFTTIPEGGSRGYSAQLRVDLATTQGATGVPPQIWGLMLGGTMDRRYIVGA